MQLILKHKRSVVYNMIRFKTYQQELTAIFSKMLYYI